MSRTDSQTAGSVIAQQPTIAAGLGAGPGTEAKTAALMSRYLPVVSGYIRNNYSWMERRGNCLVTVDDLIQVASIALVKLSARWDEILEQHHLSRDDDFGPLFWGYLKNNVKQAVGDYYSSAGEGQKDRDLSTDYGWDDGLTDPRTSVRAKTASLDSGLLFEHLMDAFSLMPRKQRVAISLVHFDNLDQRQAGDILDISQASVSLWASAARRYLTARARNEWAEYPVDPEETPAARTWQAPAKLTEYLQARHQKTIEEYLGIVTLCFRADPVYLVNIIKGRNDESLTGTYTLSPDEIDRIDRLARQGINIKEISRRLDLPYHRVYQLINATENRKYDRMWWGAATSTPHDVGAGSYS